MAFILAGTTTVIAERDELPCPGWRELYPRGEDGVFRSLDDGEFMTSLNH